MKTKNNQNYQKIKLYGSPTTKESKKKHSSRPVGGAEMGSWAERMHSKMATGGLAGEAAAGGSRWTGTSKAVAGRPGSPTSACQ